jgi:hypothetical protein
VWDIMDLEDTDLPGALVVQFIRDGFDRIINLERRWPFYETTYTLNTTAGQRDYPISSIGAGEFNEALTPPKTALREVVSILDNSSSGNRLNIVSLDEAEAVWHGAFDVPTRPLLYAEWGESIKLYPKPDTVYPLTIRGYRKPSYTWATITSQAPDLDERFHTALAYYAISQAYKRQEDSEMTQMYKQSFDEAVSLAKTEIMRTPSHRPMIMSRGAVRPSSKYWLESMGRTLGQ